MSKLECRQDHAFFRNLLSPGGEDISKSKLEATEQAAKDAAAAQRAAEANLLGMQLALASAKTEVQTSKTAKILAEETARKLQADLASLQSAKAEKAEWEDRLQKALSALAAARHGKTDAELTTRKLQAELESLRSAKLIAEETSKKLQIDLESLQLANVEAEKQTKKARHDLESMRGNLRKAQADAASEHNSRAKAEEIAKKLQRDFELLWASKAEDEEIIRELENQIEAFQVAKLETAKMPTPEKLMCRKLVTVLCELENLPESSDTDIAIKRLTAASAVIRKKDFQTSRFHLKVAMEKIKELGLPDVFQELQTMLKQCDAAATAQVIVVPQIGEMYGSARCSSSSSSSSSSAPSPPVPDSGLRGRGEGSMTDGINSGEMVAQLSAKGLQCQIKFSRYETLPETILNLGSKALIELIGDGPAHWVLKFTLEEKILLIWPGEVPHDTLVSATQVGIVVVSIHQNPEECAEAILNYLAALEGEPSNSAGGQLLIESKEKVSSKVTEAPDDSVETCVEVSDSFYNAIINALKNFDPRSFVQQQLHELQELLQDGLSNAWLSAAQQLQLQALMADVRGSLFMPMPPFKPHHDDPEGNYGGGNDPHKDAADHDHFIFFPSQPDKDPVELAGKDDKENLKKGDN